MPPRRAFLDVCRGVVAGCSVYWMDVQFSDPPPFESCACGEGQARAIAPRVGAGGQHRIQLLQRTVGQSVRAGAAVSSDLIFWPFLKGVTRGDCALHLPVQAVQEIAEEYARPPPTASKNSTGLAQRAAVHGAPSVGSPSGQDDPLSRRTDLLRRTMAVAVGQL